MKNALSHPSYNEPELLAPPARRGCTITTHPSRDVQWCCRTRDSLQKEELAEEERGAEGEEGCVVRHFFSLFFFSSAARSLVKRARTERKDGADGVHGADLGALHHLLPGDPTRQRLPVERDHRQPDQDPRGSGVRWGISAQGMEQNCPLGFVYFSV